MIARIALLLALLGAALPARALTICYNYACAETAEIALDDAQLDAVAALLKSSTDAAGERDALARAIGLFERYSGEQAPTRNDRGENFDDNGVDGRLDCIDESANATIYLLLMQDLGWLRFHRVLDPVMRNPLLLDEHWAAQVEDIANGQRWAIDSWFYDNGQPAAVFALDDWLRGATPR